MKRIICFEWQRCIRSRGTKAALGIAFFLAAGHFLSFCVWFLAYQQGGVIGKEDLELLAKNPDGAWYIYPACLYEGFIGGEGYTFWNRLYFYLLPLLAAFPFGCSLFQDESTGYLKNVYTRVKKRDFLIAKGIVGFLSGTVGAAAPYVLSFLLNALYVPAVIPNEVALHTNVMDNMSMSTWYYSKPWLYFGVYLLLIMICGGFVADLAFIVSFVAKNSLVVLAAPFLIYFSVDYICMELGRDYYSIGRLVNPMQGEAKFRVPVQHVFLLLVVMAVAVMAVYLTVGCRREKIY